ncbi:hypothetical protein RRG08_001114 [Elysia crispata]|uniref:Uncharacterized protein n=1 Tax=Elysia crispata TaxID=231223 RepID=A0AAE1E6T5_9GAST|nr:hypothetical protein RRG08_001114 [Elysia crispata]
MRSQPVYRCCGSDAVIKFYDFPLHIKMGHFVTLVLFPDWHTCTLWDPWILYSCPVKAMQVQTKKALVALSCGSS